jgi:hypothetical protein
MCILTKLLELKQQELIPRTYPENTGLNSKEEKHLVSAYTSMHEPN